MFWAWYFFNFGASQGCFVLYIRLLLGHLKLFNDSYSMLRDKDDVYLLLVDFVFHIISLVDKKVTFPCNGSIFSAIGKTSVQKFYKILLNLNFKFQRFGYIFHSTNCFSSWYQYIYTKKNLCITWSFIEIISKFDKKKSLAELFQEKHWVY